MGLQQYRSKRNFKSTPEPDGASTKKKPGPVLRFVVQLHEATRRHYDLRLELDGTMKSWAVPKGPSLDPMERRLAVEVEDHPLEYNEFEGVIPPGNYGAGVVMIWDEGVYTARAVEFPAKDEVDALRRGYAKGHMTFVLEGQKLRGEFALIRLARSEGHNWLLVKKHDQHARREDITHADRSVRSGRTLGEIASNAPKEGRIWSSRKDQAVPSASKKPKKIVDIAASAPKESRTGSSRKDQAASSASKKPKKIVDIAASAPKESRTGSSRKDQAAYSASKKPKKIVDIAASAPKESRTGSSRKDQAASSASKNPNKKAAIPAAPRQPLPALYRKKAQAEAKLRPPKPVPWKPASALASMDDACVHPFYDGYRALLRVDEDGALGLSAKTGASLNKKFPRLLQALQGLNGPLLLDGLIVPLDEQGQLRKRGRAPSQKILQHVFLIYDLLHADGFSLTELVLKDRLAALQSLQLHHEGLRIVAKDDPEGTALGLLQRSGQEPYQSASAPRTIRGQQQEPAEGMLEPHAESSRAPGSRHEVLNRTARPGTRQQVALTNTSKIYWPKEKITKGQLLDYYKHVAPWMLPHLKDRPQSLNRHPNGVEGSSFFQKEVSGAVPGWMETATIGSGRSGKTVTYALCQSEADLLFLVNMGCIEINTWLSRVKAINAPDFIVFDLDPGQIEFEAVIDVARAVKKILDAIKAPAYCKTSGSRGLHIYVPIKDAASFDDARLFAQQLSQLVHQQLPETTSLERSPERRTHKIYLDYLQNRIGQTMAAVYSVRPKPNATVSTPLRWSEVKHGLDPGIFTLQTLPKRLAKWGDLWRDMGAAAVSLPECQKALDALIVKRKKMPQPGR